MEAIQNENQKESERSFHLLVRWIEREGQEGATAGKLADALKKTELKNLAERLIGMCHKESLPLPSKHPFSVSPFQSKGA